MRATFLLGALAAAAVFVPAMPRNARACGGCFHGPVTPTETGTVVTDHQMIFVTSPQQTTLYDMIKYSGTPSSFAWVLPIRGTVTVGLSSYSLFAALDQVTAPNIIPPPYPSCPIPDNCGGCFGAAGSSGGSSGGGYETPGVSVLSQATVGPYETVQLQSTDPNALESWLSTNGYTIPTDIQPIVSAYVNDGFNFLALRLSPGQGVQAMRPVSVTSAGAGMSLPLRMVAAGTGATVGITLWAVSGGRLEAANFQNFTISASDLVWDWNSGTSNYTTLQQQKEASLNNAVWQTESSLDMQPYAVENALLGTASSGGGGLLATSEGYTDSDAGAGETADMQRQADLETLFPDGTSDVRVTRLRADLSRAALASDLVLQASADQSDVSNQYQVTQSINAPTCPNPPVCPCGYPGSTSGASGSSGGVVASSGSGSSGSSSPFGDTSSSGGSGVTTHSKNAFGCSASALDTSGENTDLFVAGIFGLTAVGARLRSRSRKKAG